MAPHESQRPPSSAGATLLTRRAIHLFVSRVVTETLTAPYRYVLLLLQHLPHCATPAWYLNLQPPEQALVRPVRVAPAPIALLRPLPLRTAPPLVIGAVALPAEAGVWRVVESGHLEWSPRPESERCIRRRSRQSCDHAGVSVGKGLIQTRPLHLILDRSDHLLHIKPRASESGLLRPEIVELLLDFDLQFELIAETRHLRVDARIFQASKRLVDSVGVWVLPRELEHLGVCQWNGEVCRIGSGEVYGHGVKGFVAPHGPDDLLPLVAVVDEGGYDLCGVVGIVGADEEGVIAER